MNSMRAITVEPRVADSLRLEEFRAPSPDQGSVLIRAIAMGVCGTDRDIIAARYGVAPPGHKRLILGHESLGRIEEAPSESGLRKGQLVMGVVRHPDPVPCVSCAAGEWDMCRNDQFTEHGIRALDGFGCELYRLDPEFVIPLDPALGILGVLVEPTSVVAKAWDQVHRIGERSRAWAPKVALITGAGPIGLATLLTAEFYSPACVIMISSLSLGAAAGTSEATCGSCRLILVSCMKVVETMRNSTRTSSTSTSEMTLISGSSLERFCSFIDHSKYAGLTGPLLIVQHRLDEAHRLLFDPHDQSLDAPAQIAVCDQRRNRDR